MRSIASALIIGWLSLTQVFAQVTVELVLDQEQFLRDESLPVKLRITNRSGQPLKLGSEKDWVSFNIVGREGATPNKVGDPSLLEEISIASAKMATRRIDLMPFFDLSVPGRYTITATVRIKQWGDEVVSLPKEFDIVTGTKIWEQEVGVPAPEGPPEVRKYILQQAAYLKLSRLYARVTDAAENRTIRVTAIGSLVSFSQPEAQVDRISRLHVLFQPGARTFIYGIVHPDGELMVRQTHEYSTSRPRLRLTDEGQIRVTGGYRRMEPTDLPPAVTSAPPPKSDPPKP